MSRLRLRRLALALAVVVELAGCDAAVLDPVSLGPAAVGTIQQNSECSMLGMWAMTETTSGEELLLVADLDGDERADALTTNYEGIYNRRLLFRRSLGDGTFEDAAIISHEGWPLGAAAGDFDGDSVTDLVVALVMDSEHGRLTLFPGVATGGLGAPIVVPSPPSFLGASIAAADMDGDGIDDLVLARFRAPRGADVLHGGPTPFERLTASDAVVEEPFALELGDFDGSGRADVVLVGDHSADLLVNDGTGRLVAATHVDAVTKCAVADLDADGTDELYGYDERCVVDDCDPLMNRFRDDSATRSLVIAAQHLVAGPPEGGGDVDGDGHGDLFVASEWGALLLLGDGSVLRAHAGPGYRSRVADVTGDGLRDVVNQSFGPLAVSVNTGVRCGRAPLSCGAGDPFEEVGFPLSVVPERLLVGDVTGDGAVDLVAVRDSRIEILVGDRTGGLVLGPVVELGRIDDLALTDMDGDGAAEVVVVNDLPSWTEIRADGSMTQVGGPALGSPRRVAVGDFDGDGWQDLFGQGYVRIMLLAGPSFAVRGEWLYEAGEGVPHIGDSLDYDGDGIDDMLIEHPRFFGARCVTFGPFGETLSCEQPIGEQDLTGTPFAIGDLDADGADDVLARDHPGGILVSSGGSTVTLLEQVSYGWHDARLMRNDAAPVDLAVVAWVWQPKLYASDGNGALVPGGPYAELSLDLDTTLIEVGDLDGDGIDEILAPTNEAEPALAVLRRCE